jgi:hypothetical protein
MADPTHYDVFVSYSHNDSDWVRGYLIPILSSWGLNVAIDNQVFIPGKTLDTHIAETITGSKQVVFVLTENFMASKWCLLEVEKTLERGQDSTIPLVLHGPKNVPPGLMNVTWADLTDRQHDENEWRKLCASLSGSWSKQTDQILDDLKDLVSFFGGFMNNKTPTYLVQRAHNVQYEGPGVDTEFMVTPSSIDALAQVLLLLGRIQKTQNVQVVLSNDNSELTEDIESVSKGNLIVLGGSRPDLVTKYAGRDFDAFYWDNLLPLSRGETLEVDWENSDWGFLIYKSKAAVDDMVMFLYSPSGGGTQMAAETLLKNFWEYARHLKGREFVKVFDYEYNLVFEHIYED